MKNIKFSTPTVLRVHKVFTKRYFIQAVSFVHVISFLLLTGCSSPKKKMVKSMDKHIQWIHQVEMIFNSSKSLTEFNEKILRYHMIEKWRANVEETKHATALYMDKLTSDEIEEIENLQKNIDEMYDQLWRNGMRVNVRDF
jgi:hypothetical protein